jgi:hypothetical protein
MMFIPPSRGRVMGRSFGARLLIRDDAGVERRLAAFESEETPDLADPITAGALARLRSEAATRGGGGARWAIAMTMLTVAAIVPTTIFGTIILVRQLRAPPWILFAMLFLAVGATVGVMFVLLPRIAARGAAATADLVVDALLRMRRCAACGYPLAHDATPRDGLHVCSECGAGWRESRFGPTQARGGDPRTASTFRAVLGLSAVHFGRSADDAGRRYGPPPQPRHMRMPRMRGDRLLQKSLRPVLLLLIVGIVTAIVLLITAAVLLRDVVPGWVLGSVLSLGAAIVPTWILLALRSDQRRTRYVLLRQRSCIACRQRLERRGERLHCPACDATWNRPVRSKR